MPDTIDAYPTADPKPYRLERHESVPLTFDGWLLAIADSRDGDRPGTSRPKWSNVYVYRTTTDKWVVAHIQQSNDSTDRVKSMIRVCLTPADVLEGLKVREGYLTKVGVAALRAAIAADPDLEPASEERI